MTTESKTNLIRKYSIKNALDYGKANSSSVLGKVLSKIKMQKKELQGLKKEVENIVNEVNKLSKEDLKKEYGKYEAEFEEEYEKKLEVTAKPRMQLEGAVAGSFATRFAPEPNGYLHIGSAKAVFLAKEFAKIYKGKLFLYFDDTNPEKETKEFVDYIKADLDWLGVKFDKEYYASDNLEKIYEYAKKLIGKNKAYVCMCKQETIKDDRFKGIECAHRKQHYEENIALFEGMLEGKYAEETTIVRYKGDMKSQNTVLRDPTLLRIKKHKHYRQGSKYIVWPTYDFNTPINDSINGVTDAIRTKEYELRDALYRGLLEDLDLRVPRVHYDARLTIKDNITHKRDLNRLIKEGLLKGFDDPRLVTLSALRIRGIQPEAIREFVLSSGMSKYDTKIDISYLLAVNKRIIDPMAKRLFYVKNPVKIKVGGAKDTEVSIKLHPTNDLGVREYNLGDTFYISDDDASVLKNNDTVRLKELFTIRIKKKSEDLINAELDQSDSEKKVQWVSDNNYIRCSILIPGNPIDKNGNFDKESLKTSSGYIEKYATNLKAQEIVQLERFCFSILHNKEKMEFIFISK